MSRSRNTLAKLILQRVSRLVTKSSAGVLKVKRLLYNSPWETGVIINMVRALTGRKKLDPWRRAKKSYYRKALAVGAAPLYPPLWDSTVLYFTYQSVIYLTNGYSQILWEANAAGPEYYSAFYNTTRTMFERFRIEKLTCELSTIQVSGYPLVQVTSCVSHSIGIHNNYTATAIMTDSTSKCHNIDNTLIKRSWYFDPTDTTEADFKTMPTAQTTNYAYGGVYFMLDYSVSNTSGGNLLMARIVQKYKVRLRGRQGLLLS